MSGRFYGAAVKTVSVQAGGERYEVLIGSGLLGTIGERLRDLVRGPRAAIVADENTCGLFAERISRSMVAAGFAPVVVTVPAGEASKSLEQVGFVCDRFAAEGLDRSSLVVAVGGGVVGDLAGFAAAIYHRGIPYVQVPTTLLAQVDSSIGGKTAVNTRAGKNLLGAVHQPVLVVSDVETLHSLPARELRQGYAEMIKHAVIADAAMLEEVAQVWNLQAEGEASFKLALLICRNVEIKAAIVAQDEQDVAGVRAVLNFGHTVGHAIERAAEGGTLRHGEAVSLGMVAACAVSVRKAGLHEEEREKVVRALRAVEMPTRLPPGFPRERILQALRADKKFEQGQVRFVVTPRLGSARLTNEVTLEEIAAAVALL
ncbi:3-dehydroquinate synthase [soil metagenome]